jgi:hypothetical protein
MDPRDRLRSMGKRMTDPVEPLAQRVAERAIDIVVNALDINALVARINLNAVLNHVDINKVLAKIDVNEVQFIDRWVGRLLRRKHPGPSARTGLLDAQAAP